MICYHRPDSGLCWDCGMIVSLERAEAAYGRGIVLVPASGRYWLARWVDCPGPTHIWPRPVDALAVWRAFDGPLATVEQLRDEAHQVLADRVGGDGYEAVRVASRLLQLAERGD